MSTSASTTARVPTRLPLWALAVAAVVAASLAALVGGAAAAQVVSDPGPLVRWGVVYARVVHDVAASATIGLLLHAAFLVPETTRTRRRETATRLAGVAAALWALASVAGALLTMADSIGIPLTDPGFPQQFTTFAWQFLPVRVELIAAGLAVLDLGGDFADGAIACEGRLSGGEVFMTFDRAAFKKLKLLGEKVASPRDVVSVDASVAFQ